MKSLIIDKGEYIFTDNTQEHKVKIKLTIYYQKKTFKVTLLKGSKRNDSFFSYIEEFAKRMIESKSNRNFYTE